MPSPSAARLTIDLDALAHNYAVLRDLAPGAQPAPVVKADGYGLGAVPVARRLWAEGARAFFVARLSEGEALRLGLGSERPATIYVLDGLTAQTGPRLAAAGLTPVLASLSQVEAAARGFGGPVALQVDTGMNRQGLTDREARDLAATPPLGLHVEMLMSHLGSATDPADPRSAAQLERFASLRPLFPQARASFAASAGIALDHVYHFDIVRPGISLFGGGPEERPDPRFRAVATFEAPILYVRQVEAGAMIGYGSTTLMPATGAVAVVAAGYADGLIRGAMGRSHAWFAGARRRVLIITMDLIAIEIGDAPAAPGDMVELLGPNMLIDDLAASAGTVAHECLVRLGGRAERVYLGEA
ncbi:alanine racemase [Phenylobacterium sp.]|uniref:alanine racemase n=1 Tax=Phenylobacterium sp. TaxID=1871053 RepID=UPI00286D38E9|nr:alanine racemase [Phenylobacterium sp.]